MVPSYIGKHTFEENVSGNLTKACAAVAVSVAQAALAAFQRTSKLPSRPVKAPVPPKAALLKSKVLPSFNNGRKLRDYQETSLHWMVNNYRGDCAKGSWEPRNCILGDEVRSNPNGLSLDAVPVLALSVWHVPLAVREN